MSRCSIERKLVAALLYAGAAPLAAAALITWTYDAGAWPFAIGVTLGLATAGAALLRHVYREVLRHRAFELQLQSANRLLQSLLDNIPTMIFAKAAHDLRFVHLNRAGEELLGIPREELLNKSDHDFFPPEQAEFFASKDHDVLSQGDVVDVPEETISTRHGIRFLHTRKVPVLDESGKPSLLLGISMDITQRKEHERRILALLDELQRHAMLLEASNRELESFCYSVSHDLRAPLRAINGFTQVLREHLECGELGPDAWQCFTRICQASEQMARLIDDLLEFSRLGRQQLGATDLDMNRMVARTVEELLVSRDGSRIDLEIEELLPARGDRQMVQRVWQNLLDNAFKYSGGAARAKIRIRSARREDRIVYEIQDNGVGFDMRYHERIFGFFERLHGADAFPGTGVGLAIVRRILSRHGGEVWAESAPDAGATFYFTLPEATGEAAAAT